MPLMPKTLRAVMTEIIFRILKIKEQNVWQLALSSLCILKIDVHWQITESDKEVRYLLISPTHRQKRLYCWVWAGVAGLCWTRPWLFWTRLKGCSLCTAAASRKKRSCAGPAPDNYSRKLSPQAPSAETNKTGTRITISHHEMWSVVLVKCAGAVSLN